MSTALPANARELANFTHSRTPAQLHQDETSDQTNFTKTRATSPRRDSSHNATP
jgi:hypothetical protein